ncbi:MAG TPA: hypothetical protein VKF38_11710 [Anaerolineaceae bacterium]|nr:hypothetical protein [Anaerolineaceae bacterium]
MKRIQSLKLPAWTVPVALLVICIASFGLLLSQLGYYWDDWAKISVHTFFGLNGYWAYYAEDRPYSGWTHIVFTYLLGDAALGWQILDLALRWLSAIAMWWCLRLLWPRARFLAAAAAMLFLIYPVFTLQPIAITFHQQWLQYVLYFLSIGLMLLAIRRPKWAFWLSIGSMLAMLGQLLITEYFIGVELLRPLFIWFALSSQYSNLRQRLVQTLKRYAPYLVVTLVYIIWRLFFIHLTGADPYRADTLYNLFSKPLTTILDTSHTILVDTIFIIFGAWASPFNLGLDPNMPHFTYFAWAVGLLCAVLIFVFFSFLNAPEPNDATENSEPDAEGKNYLPQALILGIAGILTGPIPAWVTGRQVVFDVHSNRYAQAAMFGAGLLFAAVIIWLVRHKVQAAFILSILVGVSAIYAINTSDDYRRITAAENRFSWELFWRAPYIKPYTALMTETEMFADQGLFSTSAMINLIYPQPPGSHQKLAYWAYTIEPRYDEYNIPNPLKIGFDTTFRTLHFEGSTPNTLLIQYDANKSACLWVIDPADQLSPYLPKLALRMISLSNLSRIQSQPTTAGYHPPSALFGSEPAHSWCYYFEKADLDRQIGDWSNLAQLGDQVQQLGYKPSNPASNSPHEWIPFIEGYAQTGRWMDASKVTKMAFDQDVLYKPMLCDLWQRLLARTPAASSQPAATKDMNDEIGCTL